MPRFLKSLALALAAGVILFEEWMWEPLKQLMLRFSRLPLISNLARAISCLSPRAALVTYLTPMVLLLPFKISGLWLLGHGHAVLGLFVFLAAKVVGTALFAWLFSLTRPALLQIAWFAAAYAMVQDLGNRARSWLHRQVVYRWMRLITRQLGRRLRRMFTGASH